MMMTLLKIIKSIFGLSNIREDILASISDRLHSQIGFANVREEIIKALEKIALNKDVPANFVLLGQQGLGKTIVARDLVMNYLYSIGRVSNQRFVKIEPYKLDKYNFVNELNRRFRESKGGLVFIDEVHNLREVESIFFDSLSDILKSKEFASTSFVISAGGKSWNAIYNKFPVLHSGFQNEIYFRAYTDDELVIILSEIITNDGLFVLPDYSILFELVSQMRDIRCHQRKYFENVSELVFYYNKCLKRAAKYLNKYEFEDDLMRLSLRNYATTEIRR